MEERFNTRRSSVSGASAPVEAPAQSRSHAPRTATIVAVVMTVLAVIFAALYFTKSDVAEDKAATSTANLDTPIVETVEKDKTSTANTNLTLALDLSKALNGSSQNSYGNRIFDNPLGSGYIADDGQTVHLQFCQDPVEDYYPDVALNDYCDSYDLTFSQPVAEVLVGGAGQSLGNEVVFFLLADGTVEYLLVHDALYTDQVASSGKLSGVKDVVRFSIINVSEVDYIGGYATTIAITSDGSFYDLFEAVELKEQN